LLEKETKTESKRKGNIINEIVYFYKAIEIWILGMENFSKDDEINCNQGT